MSIYMLILLASYTKYLGTDAATVSNYVSERKLQFKGVRNKVLVEEIRRMDSIEGTLLSFALNLKDSGRSGEKNSNLGYNKSNSRGSENKNKYGRKPEY